MYVYVCVEATHRNTWITIENVENYTWACKDSEARKRREEKTLDECQSLLIII